MMILLHSYYARSPAFDLNVSPCLQEKISIDQLQDSEICRLCKSLFTVRSTVPAHQPPAPLFPAVSLIFPLRHITIIGRQAKSLVCAIATIPTRMLLILAAAIGVRRLLIRASPPLICRKRLSGLDKVLAVTSPCKP